MKYLNLKLLRDLKKNWRQFFSVFLMSSLSILIFVGLQGAWHGLEKSLDNYISSADLPTVWIQTSQLTSQDQSKIKSIKDVDKLKISTILSAKINNNSKDHMTIESTSNKSDEIKVVDGKNFSNTSINTIWIDKDYASKNNLSLDDTITIRIGNKLKNLKIVGFIQSAEKIYFTGSSDYIAPNHKNYSYAYISVATFNKYFIDYPSTQLIKIYSKNNDIRHEIETILGNRLISYENRKTKTEIAEATERVGQIRNLSFLFSFIFILLAILAMFSTILRLIESQTKEIAVLKALGYSNLQITEHYISFGFLISSLGCIIGTVFSPIISLFVLNTQKKMFSIPNWRIAYSWSSLGIIGFVILICTVSSYIASRQAVKGLPAVFLRGTEKKVHHILLEKIDIIWRNITDETKWAIRDALSNKIRILMGIIGVSGGVMLLIAGIGMPSSMNYLVTKTYNKDFSYYRRLNVRDYSLANKKYDGQWIQINQAHFSKDDGYNRLFIIVDQGNFVNIKTTDGKKIQNGGVYISKSFAKSANINIGDNLTIKPYQDSKKYVVPVKGIVGSETTQGAYITKATYKRLGVEFNPKTILIDSKYSSSKLSNDPNILSTVTKYSQERNAYNFIDSLMNVFLIIIGFALLLVIVILYNLGSLNFVERTRDYATLQVLGFSKKNLQNITLLENILTTMIGWILGIPMGIWFLNQYIKTFSSIRLEFIPYANWQVLLIATLLVWFTSIGTTILFNRNINKINMVEALKGIE
ncbi:MAG: ABC transporter permease [Firmicutes bacterium]|nr:ABC transporter permease [Bacillota bacterium]